ncbi:hypothetical protein MH117_22805 [Paenibacillus sp. ACRRX]|nr:hypothetical protein [Paenibacillus sp. ACRRX]MCG7410247.1 hypothetical protein [Paenibacillus sp. ACRRX]
MIIWNENKLDLVVQLASSNLYLTLEEYNGKSHYALPKKASAAAPL